MDEPESGFRSLIFERVRALAYLALVSSTLATVAAWLSWWLWPGELASHFRVQYCWICLAGIIVLAASRRWLPAALGTIPIALNLAVIVPLYVPRAMPADDGPTLRIASINVLSVNRRHGDVLEFIRQTHPDVVLLMEVTDGWHDVIDALKEDYPYGKAAPRADNFGIALFSRVPLEDIAVRELGSAEVPSLITTLDWSGEKLTLVGTHPLNPGHIGGWRLRNEQFEQLARFCRGETRPVILAGDLNSTSWSAYFGTLLDGTRLRDSRIGFGVQASWPSWPLLPHIPIDHCLVSPEIVVRNRWIGPSIGSDHFPLVIDLGLERKAIQGAAKADAPADRP